MSSCSSRRSPLERRQSCAAVVEGRRAGGRGTREADRSTGNEWQITVKSKDAQAPESERMRGHFSFSLSTDFLAASSTCLRLISRPEANALRRQNVKFVSSSHSGVEGLHSLFLSRASSHAASRSLITSPPPLFLRLPVSGSRRSLFDPFTSIVANIRLVKPVCTFACARSPQVTANRSDRQHPLASRG